MRNNVAKTSVLLLLAVALVIASGCGQDGIRSYRVPKEQTPPVSMIAESPAETPRLKWTAPAGWQELPAGEFRVASFKVTGEADKQADVSVIPLPGTAGGDFSNVNRWRGQVGQPPVSEEEFKKLAEPVVVAGQPAALYDQAGETTRILAVILHREGMAWFFKMTGDSQLVAQQKPVFVEFLKLFQFASGAPAPAPAPAPASPGKPRWTPPAGWREVDGGQFLVAKFTITGSGNAQAAVNVSSSTGDGGGLAANLNRWRKQLGLSELTGDELTKSVTSVDTASGKAALVEMSGKDARSGQPTALVGAIVFLPGQAWFYKLMGDASVVAAQKDAFVKFVQEVQY